MTIRQNNEALIPVEISNDIIKEVANTSNVMKLARRLPNMGAYQNNVPVLSVLPTGAFVDSAADSNKYPDSSAEWAKATLTAEKIAVIIPIPADVLDDAQYDIFGELKPAIVQEFGKVFDAAVLFGTGAPASYPSNGIIGQAITKSKKVTLGTNEDLASDIIGEGGLMSFVEASGYRVSGFIADSSIESKFRNLRNVNGDLLYASSLTANVPNTLVGKQMEYDYINAFTASTALMVGGDFSKLVYAMRKDITFRVSQDGVIFNSDGSVKYNLMTQGMKALICEMRVGVAVANPATMKGNSTRYPFAALIPA